MSTTATTYEAALDEKYGRVNKDKAALERQRKKQEEERAFNQNVRATSKALGWQVTGR